MDFLCIFFILKTFLAIGRDNSLVLTEYPDYFQSPLSQHNQGKVVEKMVFKACIIIESGDIKFPFGFTPDNPFHLSLPFYDRYIQPVWFFDYQFLGCVSSNQFEPTQHQRNHQRLPGQPSGVVRLVYLFSIFHLLFGCFLPER